MVNKKVTPDMLENAKNNAEVTLFTKHLTGKGTHKTVFLDWAPKKVSKPYKVSVCKVTKTTDFEDSYFDDYREALRAFNRIAK